MATPVASVAATVAVKSLSNLLKSTWSALVFCYGTHQPSTMVASLVSSVVISTPPGWTIVTAEASRPLPLALPSYASKVILVVTILASFPR